ncbi:MAG: succinate dehydrogenase assembly factor 2 [Alphaproteobacteria bacterium]|nr:succinate dehydrogenase assembly factor 2 [Alphaproteobacteria bacterium]
MFTEARLKRLLYRARHRGMQETDVLLGRFAERCLGGMSAEQLDRFEDILDQADNDLFDWITDKRNPPAAFDHDVMAMLKSFARSL